MQSPAHSAEPETHVTPARCNLPVAWCISCQLSSTQQQEPPSLRLQLLLICCCCCCFTGLRVSHCSCCACIHNSFSTHAGIWLQLLLQRDTCEAVEVPFPSPRPPYTFSCCQHALTFFSTHSASSRALLCSLVSVSGSLSSVKL